MQKKLRAVTARRMLSLTATTAAAMGLTATSAAAGGDLWRTEMSQIVLAQANMAASTNGGAAGEGEGEGEGSTHGEGEGAAGGEGEGEGASSGDPDQALQRDLSFMEGHLRAGMALYEVGDLAAAKTHMGHPIEEKYGAVAEPLAERGFERLREQIATIAAATEAEAPVAEVTDAFEDLRATMEEVREGISVKDQVLGLAKLVRVAGEEYAVAVERGSVSNLHEYQDSWGFLRVVETELREIAETGDDTARHVAEEALAYLGQTDAAFGNIQGQGEMALDPSLLYGAAARIELEALELG